MKSFSNWQVYLAQERGGSAAAEFMGRTRQRYELLLSQSASLLPPVQHPALRELHLAKTILPGLALYQSFLEETDQATALARTERLMEAESVSKTRPLRLFFRLIPRRWQFAVFRALLKKILADEFPAEGWDYVWVEDSPVRVAFDERSCFYLDTLIAFGAPELTPVFCAGDEWVARALPASIRFERSTTLGRGGDRCDFCYRSVP